MSRLTVVGLAVAGFLGLAGCGPSVEEVKPSGPGTVAFEGKPDPTLVGQWNKDGGKSVYSFNQDGTYTFKGTVSSPGGTFPVNEEGKWAVNGTDILFKRPDGLVLAYALKVEGRDLTMTSKGSLKHETKLTKK